MSGEKRCRAVYLADESRTDGNSRGGYRHFEQDAPVDPTQIAKELYDHRLKAPPMFNEFGERRMSPYYYFVNIRHPVIAALYARFKDENNIGAYPATDLERLEFEIGLLNEEARALIWKELQWRKTEGTKNV